ncbi:putative nucleotide-binding alpha-beta plait domain superfamily, RNA-binding domain superfamily [Helianthus anomalus]
MEGRSDEQEWQDPPGRRRKGKGQEPKRGVRDTSGNITKFFVSNLPPGCTPWELSSFLRIYGQVSGSYIARKRISPVISSVL